MRRHRVRVINCASVSSGPKEAARIFRQGLNTDPSPDLVPACECADFSAHREAPDGWQIIQKGEVGSPESALVIAMRWSAGRLSDVGYKVGSAATSEGGGIRERGILVATANFNDGRAITVGNGHAPPKRARKARRAYMRVFRNLSLDVKGGDLNLRIRDVIRMMPKKQIRGIGVLHAVIVKRIPVSKAKAVRHGSDHLGVDVRLWVKRRRRFGSRQV